MEKYFKLGGNLSKNETKIIEISGAFVIFLLWLFITDITGLVKQTTIPSPISVLSSFSELFLKDELVSNLVYSLELNIKGYVEAILFSLIVGFGVALVPIFRHMFKKYIDSIRYIPITGLTGIFISWFGIGTPMKAHFLAFGVIVYLLPVVIQRVLETEKVHLDTVWTLGANSWQLFTKVYFPSTISKVFIDIRVITAISWTYIIVAEMVNNEGGIGSMIYLASKQSRIDKIFAIILFIVIIGYLQDKLFMMLEKVLFKYKFATK